jgi:hypothetical protein
MTEDRRIPVDINTAVDAVIRELDRLEGLGKDELARSGIDLYSQAELLDLLIILLYL